MPYVAAGCGVCIAAQSPGGILADAARTVPGAAGGDAAKSGSEPRRKGELLSAATSLAEGQRGRERRRRQRGVSEAGNTLCRESSSVPCLAKRRAGKKKR